MPAPSFPILPVTPNDEPQVLTHNTHHIGNAFARLLTQFQDKQRLKKMIEILLRPFQEAEDMLWSLYTDRRLDTAVGAQLDLLGKIVGEKRDGLSDTDYRAIIRVKIKVLRSTGSAKDLMVIAQLFLVSNDFTYSEHYPAAVEFVVLQVTTITQRILLKNFLIKAKSGGVRLDVVDGSGGLGVRFHYGTEGTGIGYGVGTYGSVI